MKRKAAVVGCGGIAQVHGNAIVNGDFAQLTACADILPQRAEAYSKTFGGNPYASLEEMLEKEEIDVLHICTPHVLHTPMAQLAAKKGIHVFTEKPPVISYDQWEDFQALENLPVRVGICFQNRYNQSVRYLRQLLSSGKAGKVIGARAFVTWHREAPYYTESGWRGSLATEGGGVLINQSIHTMDLLVQFLGKPVAAEATLSNHSLKGVIEVEDTLEAYLSFASGAKATFFATNTFCQDAPVFVELVCEQAVFRMEETEVTCTWKDGRKEHISFPQPAVAGKAYWGASHAVCIKDFYDAIEENRPYQNDIASVRDTAELMLAVYRSGREKISVTL
jgi:UDP-N-acetyl-2-amino-2-deoxyglucuronate dehydrogenase